MAILRGSNVNYQKNEIQNALVHKLSSAPGSPIEGQIYYDTTLHEFGYYNGTSWVYSVTTPDATTGAKGIVQLTNDLGGTATAPTVVNLHLSGDTAINHKLTTVTDPTAAQDAATKNYVDKVTYEHPVRAATSTVITISNPGTSTFDGVALSVGDRLLLLAQTTGSQNGPWVFNGSAAALTRPADYAAGTTRTIGETATVAAGTLNAELSYVLTTTGAIVDTTSTVWSVEIAAPGGAAGGDLTGSYPNPTVAASAITLAKIAAAVTLDTIATGHATAADVSINSHKLINVTDPSNPQDAATKNYVDTAIVGLQPKEAARAATTGAETYTIATGAVTTIAGTTVDGVTVAINDYVLVKNAPASTGAGTGTATTSSSNSPNGLYIVTANTTNLTVSRATPMDTWVETVGALVPVMAGGTALADTVWLSTTVPGGTLNTTAISFTYLQSALAIAGDNTYITKSGSTIQPVAIPVDPTAGANGSVVATAAALTRQMRFAIKGDGALTTFTLTHNFGNRAVKCQGFTDSAGTASTPVELDYAPTSTNAVQLTFPTAPAAALIYYILVQG